MADFNAHIAQAKHNCLVLKSINDNVPNSYDWQVTTVFYVAVHLVNAHMAKVGNHHYKSHEAVKTALFSGKDVNVPQHVYLSYVKLEGLSRRARYLCNESSGKDPENAHITYDVHLAKALRHLDVVVGYFTKSHSIPFDKIELNCIELKSDSLKFISHKSVPKVA